MFGLKGELVGLFGLQDDRSSSQSDIYRGTLDIRFSLDELNREYQQIQSFKCIDNGKCVGYLTKNSKNKIILHYQWRQFYKKEIELWDENKNNLRARLFANRLKYIHKGYGQLTSREILRGFKISGIHVGNSHHSPFWIKTFIDEFGIKSIYDPTGGWGHRLVGVGNQFPYFYNDINTPVYRNCIKISSAFNMSNKVLFNKPSELFVPDFQAHAVFTSPPYFDTEIYSDKGAENLPYNNFIQWWSTTVSNCKKTNCKYFGLVINNKYKRVLGQVVADHGFDLIREQSVGSQHDLNHFQRTASVVNKGEVLLIFKAQD